MKQTDHTTDPCPQLPVFFILGRGRSGSTLLRTMLDAHPQVCIPMESRFVQELSYKYAGVQDWDEERLKAFGRDVLTTYETLPYNAEKLQADLMKCRGNHSFADLCRIVYLNVPSPFEKTAIQWIGDKNPRYVFFIPALLNYFPHACFIHITRDYRDSTLSFYRVKGMDTEKKNAAYLAYKWKAYNREVLKLRTALPDRYMQVKYEDLVTAPEAVLRQVCTFLNLPFHPAMLNSSGRMTETAGIHADLSRPVHTEKLGIWKTQLSERDIRMSDAIVGNIAEECGYQRRHTGGYAPLSLRDALYLMRAMSGVCLKKVFYPQGWMMRLFYAMKGKKG